MVTLDILATSLQFVLVKVKMIPLLDRYLQEPQGCQLRTHLTHNDLHSENLFVDPSTHRVVALVDWERQVAQPPGFNQLAPRMAYRNPSLGDLTPIPPVGKVPLCALLRHAAANTILDDPALYTDGPDDDGDPDMVEPLLRPPSEAISAGSLVRATVAYLAETLGQWNDLDMENAVNAVRWLEDWEFGHAH